MKQNTPNMKAIFFDIDGTLVSFKTHEIPQSTIDAITQLKENGHKVFISTGRPKMIINNLSKIEHLIDGYVTMNGGYSFIGDRVISKSIIPSEDVKTLADYCKQNNLATIFVGEHNIYVCQPNKLVEEIFYKHLNVSVIPETSYEDAIKNDVLQITPFMTQEQEDEIKPSIPNCQPERWNPAFVDIVKKGTTKETGLEIMRQHFGLRVEDIIAFGDGGNDLTMLKYAGVGIAMGNAADNVKAVADYVTTSVDEDGIMNGLKYLKLI